MSIFNWATNRLEASRSVMAYGYAATAAGEPDDIIDVIAAGHMHWAETLPCHVAGEFAFAVHDAVAGTLLLGHDLLGIGSLFYAERDTAVVFGTDLAAVAARAGARDLDRTYLAEMMTFGTANGVRTPYEGVSRLMAGQSLIYGPRGLSRIEHLPDFIASLAAPKSPEVAFRQALNTAVNIAVGDAPLVATELSGGLDSSTIVCAAAAAGHAIHAISLVYSGVKGADETPWMRAVVDQYHLAWTTIDGHFALPFTEQPGQHAEPATMAVGAALHRRVDAAVTAAGTAILLSGVGGDQLCYGDCPEPHYLADLARSGRWLALARELRSWQGADAQARSANYWFRRHVIDPIANHRRGAMLASAEPVTVPPWLSIDLAGRVGAQERSARLSSDIAVQTWWERLLSAAAIAARLKLYRRDIDMRFPLLSLSLVRLMATQPASEQFGPLDDRRLQRRALEGMLPETVRQRRSKGSGGALYFAALRDNPAAIAELTDSPRLAALGLVDRDEWTLAVERASFGQPHNLAQFISAVAVEYWLRTLPHDAG